MPTSPTRFIQLTNDNSLIKYEPGGSAWSSVPKTSNMFQIGTMGSPISSSLKTTNNGTISFSFEGFDIVVVVSYIPPSSSTGSGSSPIVNCKVDDKILGTNIPQSAQNNWAICDSGNLSDGEHTLVVDIPNAAGSSIFFDYILYAPSPNSQPDLTDVSVRIEADDTSISYSGGFVIESDTGSAQLTNAGNAFIKVSFIGQQLTWYGVYSTFLPFIPSTAEYSVDGGSPIQFPLSGLTDDGSNTTALLNQILFHTEILPQGSHELTATYLGNEEHTELGLAFVVVQNGSGVAAPSTGPSGPVDTPTATPSQSTSTKSHNNRNVIIGVVVGVSGAFLLLVIGFFLFRRHIKRTLKKKEMFKSKELPESDPIRPFKTNSSEFVNRNSNSLQITRERVDTPVRLSQTVTSDSSYNAPTLIIPPIPPIIPNEAQSINSARMLTLAQSIDTPETAASLISNVQSPYTPTPTPFHIPTLPTHQIIEADQQRPQITVETGPLQTPHIDGFHSHNDHNFADVAASTTSAVMDNDRQLQHRNSPVHREVNLGVSVEQPGVDTSPRETMEMPSASPLNPIAVPALLTVFNEERYADSGVRLGRQQTLSYGALSLASTMSKDGLPPMYTSR